MNWRKIAFTIFMAAFIANAFPQENSSNETLVLTIEDAVQTALQNNISLKRTQIQLGAAERSKKYSWNSVSPSLSLGGTFSTSNKDFPNNYSASLQASVGITLSTNLYSSIKDASLRYQAGEISYENAKRTVEMNVRSAFYNLLYQDESIVLKEANINTALQQYQTNQRKYNQGSISQLDVLSSQVKYETNLPQLQSAKITRDNDMALFKQMLGLPQETQIELSGNLDDVALQIQEYANNSSKQEITKAYVESLETKNPELVAMQKNLEIAENTLLDSRFSAYGPTISAGWTYQPTWSKKAGGTATGPDDSGALRLSISIPLDGYMPWSRNGIAVSAAKDNINDLELQIENKKIDVQVATETGIRSIEQLASTIKTLQSSVDLAERTYQMTQEAYNRGTRNFTELLSARDSLEAARLNLKQQAFNLSVQVLNLENTLGIPFGTLLNNNIEENK